MHGDSVTDLTAGTGRSPAESPKRPRRTHAPSTPSGRQLIRIDGDRLKRLRLDKDINVTALAELSGYSKGLISMLENKRRTPSADCARRIAAALGCEIADLLPAGDGDAA